MRMSEPQDKESNDQNGTTTLTDEAKKEENATVEIEVDADPKQDEKANGDAVSDVKDSEMQVDESIVSPSVEPKADDSPPTEAPAETETVKEEIKDEATTSTEPETTTTTTKTPRKKSTNLEILQSETATLPTPTTPATTTTTTPASKRGRPRKSTPSFEPEDFKSEQQIKQKTKEKMIIPIGRGEKLGDIPSIKSNIEKLHSIKKDPILPVVHKFLYGGVGGVTGRGAVAQKLIRPHLLEFSGFLPKEGGDDDDLKEKFTSKAMKFQIPFLKSVCDLFDVDRRPPTGRPALIKEEVVERLVTFLGEPKVEFTKSANNNNNIEYDDSGNNTKVTPKRKRGRPRKSEGGTTTTTPSSSSAKKAKSISTPLLAEDGTPKRKRGRPRKSESGVTTTTTSSSSKKSSDSTKKKRKKNETNEKSNTKNNNGHTDDNDDDEEEEDVVDDDTDMGEELEDGKTIPSTKQLRKWVKAYINCYNMDKATTNHALETASEKFGVDLNCRKEKIKGLLSQEMERNGVWCKM